MAKKTNDNHVIDTLEVVMKNGAKVTKHVMRRMFPEAPLDKLPNEVGSVELNNTLMFGYTSKDEHGVYHFTVVGRAANDNGDDENKSKN